MINRRTVTKGLVAAGAVISTTPLLRNGNSRSAFAQRSAPASVQTRSAAPRLAIPPLDPGRMVDGVRVFDLRSQRGVSEFIPGVQTPTLGINGAYLGPVLRMSAGERVRLNVTNSIGEPTTLHWHGFHLPAKFDGGPHQVIEDGQTWSPEFEVKQHAATFWYHSHMHHKTATQVWHGLAGMIIVDDDHSRGLGLPSTYGVDDIPVVLQDRAFNRDGSFRFSTSMHNTMMGNLGGILMANGTIGGTFEATTNLVRLRLLNGSNARFWNVGFDDNRAFHQIASDGSLLPRPVKMTRVYLGPGERAEIVVDVSDRKPIALRNYLASGGGMGGMGGGMGQGRGQGQGMGMMGRMMGRRSRAEVGPEGVDFLKIVPAANQVPTTGAPAKLPAELLTLPRLKESDAVRTRRFMLNMRMGPMVMMGAVNPLTINGKVMDMGRIDETIKMGDTEIWEIYNRSAMPHPFHIHDIQFQILDRNGQPPAPHERGLKDTVVIERGDKVRIIAKFEDYADPAKPYMYHCHILEHEDAGMMGQFVVVA